jgi:flagella basal body P-ring formation protein FlgA
MIELPVLKREVRNGEIIGQNDIEIHDFPLNHSRADAVTDMSALIGKSPVRTISPQRPIREHEIASPAIVKKNAIVQMHFNAPGMEISATGQAMVEGAKGDVIDVKNVTSRKIVRAVITGTDSVDILSPGTETSQLTGGSHATN